MPPEAEPGARARHFQTYAEPDHGGYAHQLAQRGAEEVGLGPIQSAGARALFEHRLAWYQVDRFEKSGYYQAVSKYNIPFPNKGATFLRHRPVSGISIHSFVSNQTRSNGSFAFYTNVAGIQLHMLKRPGNGRNSSTEAVVKQIFNRYI